MKLSEITQKVTTQIYLDLLNLSDDLVNFDPIDKQRKLVKHFLQSKALLINLLVLYRSLKEISQTNLIKNLIIEKTNYNVNYINASDCLFNSYNQLIQLRLFF